MSLPVIPFEIHITTRQLQEAEISAFINLCDQLHAKPLLIELSRGQYTQQPMLTKVIRAHSWDEVAKQVDLLVKYIDAAEMGAQRVKVEIPAIHATTFPAREEFAVYFEWHGKVNYADIPGLMQLCATHSVHLSLNALKDQAGSRFITLREHGSKQAFEERIAHLYNDLLKGGWTITKEQSEYCIFDNNELLDMGWLQLA
ncbi:MAG: hypothetical protein JNM21_12840 [Taibaiella sp.]|nr:hypothetical protein [Taibaiella sp.]